MTDNFQADVTAIQRIDAVPRILEVVCHTTGMGFAAVARVTGERWIACTVRDTINFGLKPGGELDVATTICHDIHESGQGVAIDHVSEDTVYCGHPAPAKYGFQSYISIPVILSDGSFFGTLCALDPKPAHVNTPETIGMFRLFAELIAAHLESATRVEMAAALLLDERRASELRDQFIAVLGHDLRNPLAAIAAGVRLLQRGPTEANAASILVQMQSSVVRMTGLISNVLDFARGRLGGGFTLERSSEPIEPVLKQVIEELRVAHPDQTVEATFSIDHALSLDQNRIAQLFSNLLGNALTHGRPGVPVLVECRTDGQNFKLSVINAGEPIPPASMKRLFSPFSRGAVRPSQQGLGLGLYIASEIAKAHGGTIDVASSAQETRFTLKIPRD